MLANAWSVLPAEYMHPKDRRRGGGGRRAEGGVDAKENTAIACQQSLKTDLCNLSINQGLTAGWGLAIVVAWLQRHICCGTFRLLPCIMYVYIPCACFNETLVYMLSAAAAQMLSKFLCTVGKLEIANRKRTSKVKVLVGFVCQHPTQKS